MENNGIMDPTRQLREYFNPPLGIDLLLLLFFGNDTKSEIFLIVILIKTLMKV